MLDQTAARDCDLKHQVRQDLAVAARDLGPNFFKLRRRKIRQKPQLAHIHSQNRPLPVTHPPRRPQDRAITTEYDRELKIEVH
jgi:hypothetical protein